MRLQAPFEVITPTVDGEVLHVLAAGDTWHSIPEIARKIPERSEEGVRLVVRRLAAQGILEHQSAGRGSVYRLNREHIAADAVLALFDLRERLIERLAIAVHDWAQRPQLVALTGHAARGDMEADQPIDILLVRDGAPTAEWHRDVAELTLAVYRWTGNDGHIRELRSDDPTLDTLLAGAVIVTGDPRSLAATPSPSP